MSKHAIAVLIAFTVLMAFPPLAFPQPVNSARPMVPVPSPPTPQVNIAKKQQGCPLPAGQCWESINWAGYATTNETDTGLFTFVNASWTVPPIVGATKSTCPDGTVTWFDASVWIGVDGFNNGYVEQTGTSSDCYYGAPQYYAWYELFPAPSYSMPSADVVYPGDVMYAYVNYTAKTSLFGIWIQDLTPGHEWSFSLTSANPGATRDSAEWITETAAACIPSSCPAGADFEFLPLTHFTTVTFNGAYASINKIPRPLSSHFWSSTLNWILLVNLNWPASPGVKATPSAVTKKNSFNVAFVSSGP